jgi:hypothetical protein
MMLDGHLDWLLLGKLCWMNFQLVVKKLSS